MKHGKFLFPTLMTLVILLTLLSGCGSKTNPMDYVTLGFSGTNGKGRAELEVDRIALIESIIGKEPESFENYGKWFSQYLIYDEGISISCTPTQNLSNGETVTVTVSVSESAAKTVKGVEKKFTVTGLKEVQTVDFFRNVDLQYEGIGDNAHVVWKQPETDGFLRDCVFQIEPEYGIQNGDTVTVTVKNAEDLEQRYLVRPAQMTKTYVVSGLDEYLTDSNLLPEAEIRSLIREFLGSTQPKEDGTFTYSAPEYYKTYFLTDDPQSFYLADSDNALEIYLRYDEFMDGEYRRTIYTPLVFTNLILHPDGNISGLDYASGSSASFYTDPEAIVNRHFNAYSIEEVYVDD